MLRKIADNKNPNSLASKFRNQRHLFFKKFVADGKIKTLLDIGGTQNYWKSYFEDIKHLSITMLNLSVEAVEFSNIKSCAGDATNLKEIEDKSFDMVFSNSVIEHLYTWENQQKMANEIQRCGKSYFIQTPNKYFPLEPHFLFPFYQFLPYVVQLFLLRNFSLGHIGQIKDIVEAERQIREIRLLSKKEMQQLFPHAQIYEEKFLFFTKSLVAYKNM